MWDGRDITSDLCVVDRFIRASHHWCAKFDQGLATLWFDPEFQYVSKVHFAIGSLPEEHLEELFCAAAQVFERAEVGSSEHVGAETVMIAAAIQVSTLGCDVLLEETIKMVGASERAAIAYASQSQRILSILSTDPERRVRRAVAANVHTPDPARVMASLTN